MKIQYEDSVRSDPSIPAGTPVGGTWFGYSLRLLTARFDGVSTRYHLFFTHTTRLVTA